MQGCIITQKQISETDIGAAIAKTKNIHYWQGGHTAGTTRLLVTMRPIATTRLLVIVRPLVTLRVLVTTRPLATVRQ